MLIWIVLNKDCLYCDISIPTAWLVTTLFHNSTKILLPSDMTVLTFLCTCNNEIPLILQLAILSLPLPTSLMSYLMPCLLVEHCGSRNLPRLTGNLSSLIVCILNSLFWTNLGRPDLCLVLQSNKFHFFLQVFTT